MKKLKRVFALTVLLLILCGSMAGITVSADYYKICGDFEYEVLDDGTAKITKYTGNAEIIDIPSEIDGRKVKWIDSLSVVGCENLTNINIPESVETISWYFVSDCPNLMEINVDKNNRKYVSVDGVLFDRNKTYIVSYPCGRQGEYRIPDGVKEIGGIIFDHCHGLTKIYIPLSVSEFYAYAIDHCDNLTDIYYEGSEKRLESILYYPNIPCGNDPFFAEHTNYFFKTLQRSQYTLSLRSIRKGSYIIVHCGGICIDMAVRA